ncbi:MAG: helix-hairpin-helix domain-containing protein [Deltaproteobacteria bacterium]|uniref:Helix-hairpin-helix domain-containing protein n=1 Tax=Candidatus Zymogenus saltonus TaxID=2844893 RepID=A0A9D8KI29_9DELT|nr:helix-hairpin-helix domain-containing protein [Candidatus Zymogenus saltonus]
MHDKDKEMKNNAGLLRYRRGILIVSSLLFTFLAVTHLSAELKGLNGPSKPVAGIAVSNPDGVIEILPPGTTLRDALTKWGIDVDNVDLNPKTLDERLPGGASVAVLHADGGDKIEVSPLPARKLFILGLPFNINEATAEDLALIPGIGEKSAGWIVEYRDSYGPFSCVGDLTRVKGIGRYKTKLIEGYVVFGGGD